MEEEAGQSKQVYPQSVLDGKFVRLLSIETELSEQLSVCTKK